MVCCFAASANIHRVDIQHRAASERRTKDAERRSAAAAATRLAATAVGEDDRCTSI